MPLIKIELVRGNEKLYLLQLMNTVMDCVQETLQFPADDRNIRLIEYDPDLFIMKKPYNLLIKITLFNGRTPETKKALYRRIVDVLFEKMGIVKESVFIVLNEQPLQNWGLRGGFPANEIKLDFRVTI